MPLPMLLPLMLAAAAPVDGAYDACVDRGRTNADYAQCGGAYVRRADAALNAEWRRLMTVASGRTRADLLAEQRLWIAYREKVCRFYANADAGREGQVLAYPACVGDLISGRTRELARYRAALQPR